MGRLILLRSVRKLIRGLLHVAFGFFSYLIWCYDVMLRFISLWIISLEHMLFFWFFTWCLSCKPLHGHVMVYNAIKVPTITFVICFHRIQLLWIGYMVSDTFITWNYGDVGSICTYPTMTMRTGSTLCFTPPALK